jgi:CubicO group peptidase (beta-lactamase class C family)
MAEVRGTFDERFAAVHEALAASLEAETDLGASVAVLVEGEPVVDLWGGFCDPERTVPWTADTITNVWSTTKTMTFLCALILADHGELDFHAPVARYWPEFAASDKGRIEVRHLMGHTAGLPGWAQPIDGPDLADWEKCVSILAAQAPWWVPGTASGYHGLTQGYLIGEVVRRITSASIGTWFAEEVARPLRADFHIGLAESEDERVSIVVPPPPVETGPIDPDGLVARSFTNPRLDATFPRETWWRRAEIPAANGHGNARSVATLQAVVAGGGEAGGVRLLSERGCEPIF